jgi:hypothetical protein
MTIKDQVSEDMKTAMKARDQAALDALRLIRAEILLKEKEKQGSEADDAAMIEILQRMIRRRRDAIDLFRAGGREDLVQKDEGQIRVIERYLPKEPDEESILAAIRAAVEETGASGPKDVGRIMGHVMKTLKSSGGRVEGSKVREVATRVLSEQKREGDSA